MPDMFMANGYKEQLAQQALGGPSTPEDYVLILFTNNVTIDDSTAADDLDVGAWAGYANVSIPDSSLTLTSLVGNTAYVGTSVVPQWVNSGGAGVNVYGWALVGVTSMSLVCSQNFGTLPTVIPAGEVLTLYPWQVGFESY